LAVFLAVGSAAADPTQVERKRAEAQRVLDQIRLIDAQLGLAVERYNLANLQLDRTEAELKTNARHLVLARSSLKNARAHLSKRLVAVYVNGGESSSLEVLLGAESLEDMLNRLDAIERVGDQDARVVTNVRTFKAEVQARNARLKKAREQQRQALADRAAERRSIEGQLASRQRMLSSIRTEIAAIEAAERRRAERAAAQARARLAQQHIAVEQAQSQPAVEADGGAPEAEVVQAAQVPNARYGGVVGIAMQYLGVPYRYGGADPSGFDCSGFAMYVFAQVGVSLPHHAASQYGVGVPVAREQLQAGDLVFFNGLGHMGIYIGGEQFIHAPHTGDVVKISSLGDSWYASTWVGARRIL
jgi:cell wall-associated NlpC family hydrolase